MEKKGGEREEEREEEREGGKERRRVGGREGGREREVREHSRHSDGEAIALWVMEVGDQVCAMLTMTTEQVFCLVT